MDDDRSLSQRLHLDLPLLFGLVLLSGIGLVVLYSAGGQDVDLVIKQGIRLGIAFSLMVLVAQVAPRHFFYWSPWLYILGIGLLIAVLLVGDVGKGAKRWLDLGMFRFQPSEILKIIVPMMVAYYLAERTLPPRFVHILGAALLAFVPGVLVAWEPDLGTALLLLCAGGFVVLLAGMRWQIMVLLGVVGAACAPLLWFFMHDYQRRRVLTFLNPEQDPLGAGYHIIQSKIAIGSGGLFGKGWLNGTQSQLDFLPERSTDFVFAVFSEEFGLMGIITLLTLYLFVVFRGLYLALNTQELFGRLLGASLVLTFFVYVFVNIGMVSGLLPVVGLPLPLISYGGTSLVTLMAAFGMLMSLHAHRRMLSH